ncbi:uncharacterized protein LOC132195027 [Neocloeon triangulifer]|uniref:uncharacterized protein LOC132195027 n=1 Tax=Neocloeon triangulifer TaxID=2078957 RepID=UPI00286F1737|nr:uncharacterized protein LOC132195027 [Neocloeon triangulifer]
MWPANIKLSEHDEVLVEIALAVSLLAIQNAPEDPQEWLKQNPNYENVVKECRGKWVSVEHQKSVKSDNLDRNVHKWHRKNKELIDLMINAALCKRQESQEDCEIEGKARLLFFDKIYPATQTTSSKNAKRQKHLKQILFVAKNTKKGKGLPSMNYTELTCIDQTTNLQVTFVKEPSNIPQSVVNKANLSAEAAVHDAQKGNSLSASLIHMAVSSLKEAKTNAAYKELTKEVRNLHLSKMFEHLEKNGGLVSEESEIERFLYLVESKEKIKQRANEENIKESHIWIQDFQFKCVRVKLGRCCLCSTTKLLSDVSNLTLQDWELVQKEEELVESAFCKKCKKNTNLQLLYVLSHNYLLIEPTSMEYPRPPKKSFKEALAMFKDEVQIGGVDFLFCTAVLNLKLENPEEIRTIMVTKKDGRFHVTCACQDPGEWSVGEECYRLGLTDKKVFTKLVLYLRKE